MKITHGLFALSLATALAAGCTTKKYYTNGDGGTAPASVSNISPSLAFTGQTIDVQITGSATDWDSSTTVDFGMGITVNKLTVASPAAMTANVTIDAMAATGTRDVTVTAAGSAEPYKMTFNVQNQVDVTVVGTATAGATFEIKIINNDLAHPFDTTTSLFGGYADLSLSLADGYLYDIVNATTTELDAVIFADVMASPGPFDVDVLSGPDPSSAYEYKHAAAFTVGAAPTPAALTDGAMTTIASSFGSTLYKFTPMAANELVTISSTDTGGNTQVVYLHASGSFLDVGSTDSGASVTFDALDTTPVYVLIWNAADASNVMATVNVVEASLNVQAGGEGDDTANNTDTGAISLDTPPVIVEGASLSSAADEDWYKLMVPMGKIIHVNTSAGDADTDTVVTFYASDGTTAVDNQEGDGTAADGVDNGNQEDAHSVAVTTSGLYYIKISYSQSSFATPWATTNSHYNMTVTLE